MTPIILFALLAGLPLLLVMLLRVHSSAFFISVASGYLLTQFVGDTAGLVTSSVFKNSPEVTLVGVFLLPLLLTMWFMRKSMPSPQILIQLVPQLANSLLVFVLLAPLLSADLQATLQGDAVTNTFLSMNDAVVAAAVATQLFLMIMTARPNHSK